MKKFVFVFLIAVALPLALSAQNEVGTFSVIPKAGVSIANISGSEVLYFDGKGEKTMKSKYNPRITAGVDVEYRVHEYLGVVLGVAYSQQGCRRGYDGLSEEIHTAASERQMRYRPLFFGFGGICT